MKTSRPWWQIVLAIVVASIVFIELAGLIGTKVLVPWRGLRGGPGAFDASTADTVQGRFARWDSRYYLKIADTGYRGKERAFFPLYPLIMRQVRWLSGLSLLWSGTLTTILCFVLACLVAYRWVLCDYEHSTAVWTVVWMCVLPMSLFFVAIYSESLFLLLSLAALYLARRGHFLASGIIICLAGATRPVGMLIVVPYVVEFVYQRDFGRRRLLSCLTGLVIAPVGLASYLMYLGRPKGLLAGYQLYSGVQAAGWARYFTWPWVTLFDGIRTAVFGMDMQTASLTQHAAAWEELGAVVLALLLSVWAAFRLRPSMTAYLLVTILFLLASHSGPGNPLISMPRLIAGTAPLYVAMAAVTVRLPGRFGWLLAAGSALLLALLTAWFASGRWVA